MKEQETVTRAYINERLRQVYDRIGIAESNILRSELEEIARFRPIDNYYVYVAASLEFNDGVVDQFWKTLAGKDNWYFPGPYAPLLAQIQYEAARKTNAPFGAKMQQILAYYTYMAATTGTNKSRECHADLEFVEKARGCYEEELTKEQKYIQKLKMETEWQSDELSKLFEIEYNLGNWLLTDIIAFWMKKIFGMEPENYSYYLNQIVVNEPNRGYLLKTLSGIIDNRVLIVTDEYCMAEKAEIIARIFEGLGNDTVVVSRQEAVAAVRKDDCMMLITSRETFTRLKNNVPNHVIQCLTQYKGELHQDELCFGYVGDYLKYISEIYEYDYETELNKTSEILFSIIIPARNSGYMLRHTLKTVLNQQDISHEDYEIVVSDNSTGGNEDVRKVVEAFADKRIRYYKTPVDLPLQRSFEFAYGKARGKYLIPIGSDDGLLPWSLNVLKEMTNKYPEQKVIGWERGFFQWTESESNQRGKFVIPRGYQKGKYEEKKYNSFATLYQQIQQDGKSLYSMPLFYINTAFCRELLLDSYKKTGYILDGYTQDVGMMVRSSLLNKEFLFLKYPLSIAGMSDGSLGTRMALEAENDEALAKKNSDEIKSGFGSVIIDELFPFQVIASTEGMLWSELFRAYMVPELQDDIKVLLQNHDFKTTFVTLTGGRSRNALDYSLLLEKLRWNACQIDQELGKWFEDVVYKAATDKLFLFDEKTQKGNQLSYKIEEVPDGRKVLNAAEYGVNTIDEAVELFEALTKL